MELEIINVDYVWYITILHQLSFLSWIFAGALILTWMTRLIRRLRGEKSPVFRPTRFFFIIGQMLFVLSTIASILSMSLSAKDALRWIKTIDSTIKNDPAASCIMVYNAAHSELQDILILMASSGFLLILGSVGYYKVHAEKKL